MEQQQQQHIHAAPLPVKSMLNLDQMKHTLQNIQNISHQDLITICTSTLSKLQKLQVLEEIYTEDTNRSLQRLISYTANARGKFNYTLLYSMNPEIQFRTDLERYNSAIEEAEHETSYDKYSRENIRPESIRFNQNSIHLTHDCDYNCTFSPLDRFCENNCNQCNYCIHASEKKNQHKNN